jgi:hypothetical protein
MSRRNYAFWPYLRAFETHLDEAERQMVGAPATVVVPVPIVIDIYALKPGEME